MTRRTAIIIATNYPNNIRVVGTGNEDLGHGAVCYLLKDNRAHTILLATDLVFDNPDDPINNMKSVCEACVKEYAQ